LFDIDVKANRQYEVAGSTLIPVFRWIFRRSGNKGPGRFTNKSQKWFNLFMPAT
jgi:hypothetical protein